MKNLSQAFKNMLVKFMSDKTAVHASSHFSPCEVVFGHNITLRVDLDVSKQLADKKLPLCLEEGGDISAATVNLVIHRHSIFEEYESTG